MHKFFFKIIKSAYKTDQKGVIKLNFLLILSSILESASVAIIFPILALLVNNSKENFFYDINVLNLDKTNLVFYSLIIFLLFFVVKSLILLYFSWWKSGFVFKLNNIFSKKILENYLYKNIEFYLKNKPSALLRNSYEEVRKFVTAIDYFFRLLSEIFIFLFISIGLFIFQPKVTLVIFIFFGLIGICYIGFTKNFQKKWSEKKIFFSGNVLQILQQAFECIKYIKVSNTEKIQLKKHKIEIENLNKYSRYSAFFADVPKNFLETAGVIVLIIIIFTLYNNTTSNLNDLIPTLGLFAAASFRILPGLNRIIGTIQLIYSMSASIEIVYNDLNSLSKKNDINITSNIKLSKYIIFENVCYKYPESKNFIFKNLSLKINKNDFICIKGASGIGKTTLIDLISGIISPTEGSIKIDDKNIKNELDIKAWQRGIGYIPQSPLLFNGSILENITFFEKESEIDHKKVKDVVNFAELDSFINQFKEKSNYKINERGSNLSGGQIQRIAIARSLYLNPEILICDEFTSSLDENLEEKILNSLKKLAGKITIVYISHNPKLMKIADKTINLFKLENQQIGVQIV